MLVYVCVSYTLQASWQPAKKSTVSASLSTASELSYETLESKLNMAKQHITKTSSFGSDILYFDEETVTFVCEGPIPMSYGWLWH